MYIIIFNKNYRDYVFLYINNYFISLLYNLLLLYLYIIFLRDIFILIIIYYIMDKFIILFHFYNNNVYLLNI